MLLVLVRLGLSSLEFEVPLTKALRGLNLGSAALLSRFATGLS